MKIDLHTHSTCSDGTRNPEELVFDARDAGIQVVGLTDHDTTAGWDLAGYTAEDVRGEGYEIRVLPGVEISTKHENMSVHILGYLIEPNFPGLVDEWEKTKESRSSRAHRIVEAISQDYDLTMADVLGQVRIGATLCRPHIADALIARGHVPNRAAAFAHILNENGPYYVGYHSMTPMKAVELVRAAGGVSVIAHPFSKDRQQILTRELLFDLVDAGLNGIEADHPEHDKHQRELAHSIAADAGLFATGSSDYHGAGKPNRLGECTTSKAVLRKIMELSTSGTTLL